MSMRESVAKRRPMIDLEQFERRLRQPNAAEAANEDPLAELARLVGGQDDPYKAMFERKAPAAPPHEKGLYDPAPRDHEADFDSGAYEAPAQNPSSYEPPRYEPSPYEPSQWQAAAREPHAAEERFSHDSYDAVERGFDSDARRGDALPRSPGRGAASFAPAEDGFDDWREPGEPDYAEGPAEREEPRSRRPLYIMAGIIIAGIAGIGATFALKSGSSTHQIATIRPADGPVKIQPESTGGSDAPSQEASILSRTPQAAPVAVADGAEQPVDLSRMPERAPRVIALNGAGSAAAVPVPPPPAHAQTAPKPSAEPMSIASLIEPKKVKTVSVRPDGTLVPADHSREAAASATPPAATTHGSAPIAKPATPKSTARVSATPGADSPAAASGGKTRSIEVASAEGAVSAPASGGGGFAVQLAAPTSEQEARDIQSRLIKKYAGVIPGFHPAIRRAVSGDKTVYRVRSVGLSKDEATALCQKVQGAGGACFVAKN